MFLKLKNTLRVGLLGLVLAYSPACKEEIKIVKLSAVQERPVAVQEDSLEQKVAKVQPVIAPSSMPPIIVSSQEEPKPDVPPTISVERWGADGKIIKEKKCSLEVVNFKFCGAVEKKTYRCIGEGSGFYLGGEAHFIFYVKRYNLPNKVSSLFRLTKGNKNYNVLGDNKIKRIRNNSFVGFKGIVYTKSSWPSGGYNLRFIVEEGNCKYDFKKEIKLHVKEYEEGWSP